MAFLNNVEKKAGPSPLPRPGSAFLVIKLTIGLYLPNVDLMLARVVDGGPTIKYPWVNVSDTKQCKMHIGRRNQMRPRTIIRVVVNSHIFGSITAFIFFCKCCKR